MIIEKPLPKDGDRVWKVSTAPTVEPVTATELKTFARIDTTSEDTLIEGFIKTARQAAEEWMGRALLEQTITMKMDFWPDTDYIELPRPPLLSVTGVYTLDEDDAATTYSSANYFLITEAEPGRLVLKNNVTPPSNTSRYYGGYQVIYKAGYGTAATDVPQLIKDGIKIWATYMYEKRLISDEPPEDVKKLLNYYKIPNIIR